MGRKSLVFGTIFLLLILSFTPATASPAGWSDDTQLTSTGDWKDPEIAVNGSNVHTIWRDDGFLEIFYRRSTDRGFSWDPAVQISDSGGEPIFDPDIVVQNDVIHAVWDRLPDGFDVYYVRSKDNGDTWTMPVQLSDDDTHESQWPSVGCEGNNVYVVWGDDRHGMHEIYFKNSSDGGNTWSSDKRLTFHQTGTDDAPAIIATPTKLHLVYGERTGGSPSTIEVMYRNSTDGGATWSTPVMLSSDNDAHSEFYGPNCFAVDGDDIHVVWEDQRHLDYGEVYYRNSTDGGLSWNPEVRLIVNDSSPQESPRVCAKNDFVQVFWSDDRNKDRYMHDIYSVNSTDGGISWNSEYQLTFQPWPINSAAPNVAIDDGYTHLLYYDNRTADSDRNIYYKRSPDFTSPIPEFQNLLAPVLATILVVGVATRVGLRKNRK